MRLKRIPLILSFAFFAASNYQCAANTQADNVVELSKSDIEQSNPEAVALKKKAEWVNSSYQKLTMEEKIGQLFMVAAYSAGKDYNYPSIKKLVEEGKVGGVIYMQGNAEAQIEQTNTLQKSFKLPILISMDAEWGLGMRLTGALDYPKQMMMGATNNVELMRAMGESIGNQLKAIGAHIDFAPVVDVNNNPLNPVINFRAFGEDKEMVYQMGKAYMDGLHAAGILAVAKHFPGHGDVSVDSHLDMPVIRKSKEELMNMEFYPYIKLIDDGLKGVLTSHLNIPAIDNRKNRPATVSYPIITETLKEELGFNGLIFTDAMNMAGLTKYFQPGHADLEAFKAGNDVLLFSQNPVLGIKLIKEAIEKGEISEKQLEQSVKKILALKYDMGLDNFTPINPANATQKANKEVKQYRTLAAKHATTLYKGDIIKNYHKDMKVAHIHINAKTRNYFSDYLKNKFNNVKVYDGTNTTALKSVNWDQYDAVIITVHSGINYPGKSKTYGVNTTQIQAVQSLIKRDNVYVGLLVNPYLTDRFCQGKNVIIAYENNEESQAQLLEVLIGNDVARGKAPVSVCR